MGEGCGANHRPDRASTLIGSPPKLKLVDDELPVQVQCGRRHDVQRAALSGALPKASIQLTWENKHEHKCLNKHERDLVKSLDHQTVSKSTSCSALDKLGVTTQPPGTRYPQARSDSMEDLP